MTNFTLVANMSENNFNENQSESFGFFNAIFFIIFLNKMMAVHYKNDVFKALESQIVKTIFNCWQCKVNSANLNS